MSYRDDDLAYDSKTIADLRKKNRDLDKQLKRQNRWERIKNLIIKKPVIASLPIVVIFMYIIGMGFSHSYLSKYYKDENIVDAYTMVWPFTIPYVIVKRISYELIDGDEEKREDEKLNQLLKTARNEAIFLRNKVIELKINCKQKDPLIHCAPECSGDRVCCAMDHTINLIREKNTKHKTPLILEE
jgi:hypothetical protein